ncbi:hypothetical protein PPTG_11396 [Phytophthora nicotianae INRA-310]|uniref:Uncharacterized protein n=1 Tax=Phytophthora nicotianae (strain INRA-310) TaxID=761204 RepID=W2Q9J2_PHYN3|nr:hypothetical protein PPTG_11396 [Phytophthora nicotianae INRA-310]ETN09807.1 hypothetical protein PPTG_11396 [Phytophthora nicotianae INRA-310]
MRAERGEEAAMLLSAYQRAAQRDAATMRQRRRTLRTLLGVIGAVALFVGCIAAVDVMAMTGNGSDTMTLEVSTEDEAIEMESQFGWNSIGYGWCSVKASTWCMFSKDKEKCKENIDCYKKGIESGTRGAGSSSGEFGDATVGDSSSDDEVGAPMENPSQSSSNDEEEGITGGEETGGEGNSGDGSKIEPRGGED